MPPFSGLVYNGKTNPDVTAFFRNDPDINVFADGFLRLCNVFGQIRQSCLYRLGQNIMFMACKSVSSVKDKVNTFIDHTLLYIRDSQTFLSPFLTQSIYLKYPQ